MIPVKVPPKTDWDNLWIIHALITYGLVGLGFIMLYATPQPVGPWIAFAVGLILAFLLICAILFGFWWVWDEKSSHTRGFLLLFYTIPLLILPTAFLYAALNEIDSSWIVDRSGSGRWCPYAMSIDILTLCGIGPCLPMGVFPSVILSFNQLFVWILGGLLLNSLVRFLIGFIFTSPTAISWLTKTIHL